MSQFEIAIVSIGVVFFVMDYVWKVRVDRFLNKVEKQLGIER